MMRKNQLAKIINSRWLNKLSDESLGEKLDIHLRPVKCDWLITVDNCISFRRRPHHQRQCELFVKTTVKTMS
jgi:ABC-type enterochelin transport system ATPase subunit